MTLLTIEQAARHCRIGRTYAWQLAKNDWPVIRLGRLVRIDEAALDRWLEQQAAGSARRGTTLVAAQVKGRTSGRRRSA